MKSSLLILPKKVKIEKQNNCFLEFSFFTGTFRSAMSKLDYLVCELGINCIQLMPVQAFLLGHDWGYTTKYFLLSNQAMER